MKRGALFQYKEEDDDDLFDIQISSKNYRLKQSPRTFVKRKFTFGYNQKSSISVARQMNPNWKAVVKASYNQTFTKDANGKWQNCLKNHIEYISRDSAGIDGKSPTLFNQENDNLSQDEFIKFSDPIKNEKYHFRLILSPETNKKIDLMDATREVVDFIEERQGVGLQWVAAIHENTGRPHVHLDIRGVDTNKQILRIKKSLIKSEIREHLEEWINEMYGQKTLFQVISGLEHEVKTPNVSRFDRQIAKKIANEKGKNPYGYTYYVPQSEWEDRRLRVLEKRGYSANTIWKSRRAWKIRNDFMERLIEDEKRIDRIKQQNYMK